MNSLLKRAAFYILLLAFLLPLYAGDDAAPVAQSSLVPDWAVGSLYFKQLGVGMDKAGVYANKLVPNSAELAKQIAMNALFKMPLDAGLKKDGPAQIFMLDPFVTRVNDQAFILPVADAAAMKTSLINTFGAPEEDAGTLVFTLPQPLPAPDKKLLIRFTKDRMLVSPDGPVLKKLEEYVAGKDVAAALNAVSSDALLTMRMQSVRRIAGDMLGMMLEMGAAQAAGNNREQAARLSQQIKSVLATIWEVDLLQARLDFQSGGESGTVELRAIPLKGSGLAGVFQKFNTTVNPALDSLLPSKSALQFKWRMSGSEIADLLNKNLTAEAGSPVQAAANGAVQAFSELLKSSNGDAGISIGAVDQKPVFMTVMGFGDAPKIQPKFKEALEKSIVAILEAANFEVRSAKRAEMGVRLKDASTVTHGGMSIYEHVLDFDKITAEEREAIGSFLGADLAVRYAIIENQIVLALGASSLSALKNAIDKRKDARPAAGANTIIQGIISSVRLANLFASGMPVTAAATRGLSEAEVTIELQQIDGALALRFGIPADAAFASSEIPKRLRRANIRLEELLEGLTGGGDAPAPAPATVP